MSAQTSKIIRNGLIAKIHIAKKDLGFDDDIYRTVLHSVTQKESCGVMNNRELESVYSHLKTLGAGAQKKAPARAGERKMDWADQSRKIRALWLNLYHLGALSDPSEEALCGFVERMTGIKALQWLYPEAADKAIKALRGWLERVGYYHPKAADYKFFDYDGQAENVAVLNAQARILEIDNILAWINHNSRADYQSLRHIPMDELMRCIEILGSQIRRKRGGCA